MSEVLICDLDCTWRFFQISYMAFGIFLGVMATSVYHWHKQGKMIWNRSRSR